MNLNHLIPILLGHDLRPIPSNFHRSIRLRLSHESSNMVGNAAPNIAAAGGAAVIGVSAPDGISFATPKTIVSYAGVNLDGVAQQHLQFTAGQQCNLNAGKGISLFAQNEGIKAIAHHGTFLMQSQHDNTSSFTLRQPTRHD